MFAFLFFFCARFRFIGFLTSSFWRHRLKHLLYRWIWCVDLWPWVPRSVWDLCGIYFICRKKSIKISLLGPYWSELPDLLHSFKIFSELGIEGVGSKLKGSSILKISLSVQEPGRDTVSNRVAKDVGEIVDLIFTQFTSSIQLIRVRLKNNAPSVDIDFCLFAEDKCKSSTNTLDDSDGIRNLSLTINVCV